MRFKIEHNTRYRYSEPVFLEPHTVRLRPRCDASQRVNRYCLVVTPEPAGLSEGLDAENNDVALIWFEGLHTRFDVAITIEVETLRVDPFEGLLVNGADHLPLHDFQQEEAALRPYLSVDGIDSDPEPVGTLTRELLADVKGSTLAFLGQLNARLYRCIEKVTRSEPGIQSPRETLHSKKGACRDLAYLFMAICRQAGLPARFVSGYQQGDPDDPYNDLHAWAEVYLPGFGWRGYDPTHGLAVADRHIVLAAASQPGNAAPVTGSYRGTDVHAAIDHLITIR